VVTGASTEIGEATALRLADAGWQVFAGVRSNTDADRLAKEGGQHLTPVHLDVTDQGPIEQTVALVSAAVGRDRLGGLVNNAGIGRGVLVEYL
jgi:NAD(P)-dependent dehydrogenase (short-subunit alcohol dehydrogenase family)